MSVYQGSSGGGQTTGPTSVEAMNLDMEQMSADERSDYLTQRLGSPEMAAAYLRAMTGHGDAPAVAAEDAPDVNSKIVGCQEFTESVPDTTRISNHYTLAMLSSQTAYTKYPIVPHLGLSRPQIMCNLKFLATNTLDPIKDWDSGMKIGSGFRSNSTTDHGKGCAADLYFYKKGTSERISVTEMVSVARHIIYELKVPFTQLLIESSGNGTWLHIANRRSGNSDMRIGFSLDNGASYHAGFPAV